MIRTASCSALLCLSLTLVAPLVLPCASATAQEDEGPESMEFQAVDGPNTEDVPGGMLMVAAYGTVLLLLVGFVARIGMMQSKTRADIARLERSLAASDAKSAETETGEAEGDD